jgi:SAM-dependent methyltransferase
MKQAWFETWFDSPYYHLLYQNRNEEEARQFLDALLQFLNPSKPLRFIDVACGKGRHSLYLHSLGHQVTGIDLSENSIQEAKTSSQGDSRIAFFQHDIRTPFPIEDQDVALNLFTSFGYFESDAEHMMAFQHIRNCLKPKGTFVFDFLNAQQVMLDLKKSDECRLGDVTFKVKRQWLSGHFVKSIEVNEPDGRHHFQEKVRAFQPDELVNMLEQSGFRIVQKFGNYLLQPFQPDSPRLVIIAEKKA